MRRILILVLGGIALIALAAEPVVAQQPPGQPPNRPVGPPADGAYPPGPPDGRPVGPPPGRPPACTPASATVAPGGTIEVQCSRFAPGSSVAGTMFSPQADLGTRMTDAEGQLHTGFIVPMGTSAGQHTLRMQGVDTEGLPVTETVAFTVSAAGDTTVVPSRGLPTTGGTALLGLLTAGGLLAVGGGALVVARRRNHADASA